MLPSGILDGASSGVTLREAQNPLALIKTFEDAKNLDRVNEMMPQRKNSTSENASRTDTPKTSVTARSTTTTAENSPKPIKNGQANHAQAAAAEKSSTTATTDPTAEQNKSYSKKVT